MAVYCDMVTSGGGWTLIMVRENPAGTTPSDGLIEPSSHGQAMTEARLQALRAGATEVMVQQSGTQAYCGGGCTSCVIGDVARMNLGNCKSFRSVASLTEVMWAHYEDSGCAGTGGDYSIFMGYSDDQKTYFSSVSSGLDFYRGCTSGSPSVSAAFQSGTYSMYQHAAVYLRHTPVVYPRTCTDVQAADPSAPSGVHLIALGGAAGVEPMAVYCDMVTSGGGWTLIMVRENPAGTTPSDGLIEPSSHGQAMTEARLQALRAGATEVMVQQSGTQAYCGGGCTSCVIGDVARMNLGNCKSFRSVASLTEVMWAHYEDSGCAGTGGDYSIFMGYSDDQKTYFSSVSSGLDFYRGCTSGSPSVSAAFQSGTYSMYQHAAVYLRHS